MLEIVNDGERILSTTYWRTDQAHRGLVYISLNAGAVRVLAPHIGGVAEDLVEQLAAGHPVVLSTGWWGDSGLQALELLVDDGSDEPWVLHIDSRQSDRVWPKTEDGRLVPLIAYGEGEKGDTVELARTMTRLRHAAIPCLEPWRG